MSILLTSLYTNSVFEQPWWLDAVAPDGWREILIEENGEVVARWPIVEKGNNVIMPPLTQTLGFWIADRIMNSDPFLSERKRITNLLLEQLPQSKMISINLDPKVNYFLPMYWNQFEVIPHISYRFNDLTNVSSIYDGFSRKVRQTIRNASQRVKIEHIDDIDILHKLLEKTFERKNLKNPWSSQLLRDIYSACKRNNAGYLIYAIDKEENIHSGNFYVFDSSTCYALISGTDPDFISSGARTLLLWEGIKHASSVSSIFDFEGSMVENIEHYFRQFKPTPYVYYHILKQRDLVKLHKLTYRITRNAVKSVYCLYSKRNSSNNQQIS